MTNDTTVSVGDSIQVATLKALQGLTGAISAINDRLDRLEAPTATFQVAESVEEIPEVKTRKSAPKGAKRASALDRFTPEMAKAIRNRRRPNGSELAAAALKGSKAGLANYGLRFQRGKYLLVSPDATQDGDILVSVSETSGKGQPRYRLA